MDPTVTQILTSPITTVVAILAAAGGGILGALVGLRQLRHSISAQAEALQAQNRATQLEAFTHFNMKFLDIAEKFDEHINDENIGEQQLSPSERRAIDRYFYLASMEFNLYKEKIVDEKLCDQWIRGIRRAAKRKPFVERWHSTAKRFTLNEDFRQFFESSLEQKREA